MSQRRRPWKRKRRGKTYWYVTLDGKQTLLGIGDTDAVQRAVMRKYHRLMLRREGGAVTEIMTAHDAIGQFLDDCEFRVERGDMAKTTAHNYRRACERWRETLSPALLAEEIRIRHLTTWLDSVSTLGHSGRRTITVAIKRCWSWLRQQGYIEIDHLADAPVPPVTRRKGIWTQQDLDAFLAVAHPRTRDIIQVIAEQGCRTDEPHKVTAAMIDWNLGAWVIHDHKTKRKTSKPRVVWMTPTTKRICKRLCKQHPEGPIFRAPTGLPWNKPSLVKWFAIDREKAGLPTSLTPYQLRHTFATKAMKSGELDIATIAGLMGHSTPATMLRIYQHVADDAEHMRKAAAKLSGTRGVQASRKKKDTR